MNYIKKPTIIQALQWDGTEITRQSIIYLFPQLVTLESRVNYWIIDTPRGKQRVLKNDWIIQDTDGSLYPCHDETFNAMYTIA